MKDKALMALMMLGMMSLMTGVSCIELGGAAEAMMFGGFGVMAASLLAIRAMDTKR